MDEEVGLSESALEELRQQYYADDRAWVVAYSGGKDSTLVLQLVYEFLLEEGAKASKPVYVISSDTLVEAPNVAAYVRETISAIDAHSKVNNLPLYSQIVSPAIDQTFWAKLIGKGYPPPTRWFRWCTTNMKIKPSRAAIEKITAAAGSVILLLGTRRAESSSRKQRMDARDNNARSLNPHHEIPNSLVYTPIADWEDDDVWEYLSEHNPPPWGKRHDQMLTLYRQAVGGECPLVVDLGTPSCGGSRFGCWTCTVVKADKSMQGFIETGDEWMRPLAEFRDWLKEFREQQENRSERRRDGSLGPGPFTPQARITILDRLLQTERAVGIRLITDRELIYIQSEWSREFDLADTAIAAARNQGREVGGDAQVPMTSDDRALLEDLAVERGLSTNLIDRVLNLESEFPNLDKWGARPELRRRLEELIAAAEVREQMAK